MLKNGDREGSPKSLVRQTQSSRGNLGAWSNARRWERQGVSTSAPLPTDQGDEQALLVTLGAKRVSKREAMSCSLPRDEWLGVGAEAELQKVESKFLASEVARFLI